MATITYSVDTFYSILCSGITKKTKVSFNSSNSSFAECVRKHTPSSLSSSFLANSNCALPTYTDCSFTQVNRTSLSSSASFTLCRWTKCESDDGGGIYLKAGSSVTLSVTTCDFYECKATEELGGGIYCDGIGIFIVENSLFKSCTCKAKNYAGGGGIGVHNIQTKPEIKYSDFIHCSSGNDGGGISIRYSYSYQNTLPITKCRFFSCSANNSDNGDAGAIHVWRNKQIFGVSDCLFSLGHSVRRAGAISFGFDSKIQVSFPFICFSFFTGNTAPNGTDISFYNMQGNPILRSFTKSASNNVYDRDSDNYLVNWLPEVFHYSSLGNTSKTRLSTHAEKVR